MALVLDQHLPDTSSPPISASLPLWSQDSTPPCKRSHPIVRQRLLARSNRITPPGTVIRRKFYLCRGRRRRDGRARGAARVGLTHSGCLSFRGHSLYRALLPPLSSHLSGTAAVTLPPVPASRPITPFHRIYLVRRRFAALRRFPRLHQSSWQHSIHIFRPGHTLRRSAFRETERHRYR
ncbi:hypothetical protein BGW80DRAFT_85412 [Lactifluus volemus]|nr:hypothetical protein BGW80DRAFT_85412 [Lactifluus volemus]